MRTKIMGYVAFGFGAVVIALTSKYSGSGIKGLFFGILTVFILAAIDCIFDSIEEKKRKRDDMSKIAEYVHKGMTDGLKVEHSFIDEAFLKKGYEKKGGAE